MPQEKAEVLVHVLRAQEGLRVGTIKGGSRQETGMELGVERWVRFSDMEGRRNGQGETSKGVQGRVRPVRLSRVQVPEIVGEERWRM